MDGIRKKSEGFLGLELGIEKVLTLDSSRIDGNALRLIPRLELKAPGAGADSSEPLAFARGGDTWRPGAGGNLEFTWNTFRTLSAQTLYTTSLGNHRGRRPGDVWETLLGYSERHGATSLHLRAEATLWLADQRAGGRTPVDLDEAAWEFALRPGLSIHLADKVELFVEGRLPLGGGAIDAGGGTGLFIGLAAGF